MRPSRSIVASPHSFLTAALPRPIRAHERARHPIVMGHDARLRRHHAVLAVARVTSHTATGLAAAPQARESRSFALLGLNRDDLGADQDAGVELGSSSARLYCSSGVKPCGLRTSLYASIEPSSRISPTMEAVASRWDTKGPH